MIDEILQRIGLKYEDLTSAERDTLSGWMEALDSNQLTLDRVRVFVHQLRDHVEQEVVTVDNGSKQDIFLKARLRNLMLIEAFMTSPEQAKAALERAIAGIANNRKV